MGKSMLLVYCEQQIAQSERLILPLRVGAGPGAEGEIPIPLSTIDWTNQDTALKFLAETVLYRLLPEYKDDLQDWLQYLVKCKTVVFLLDALDQTKDVDKLPAFLQSKDIAECVVLMTGRPETGQTKNHVRQIDWDEVWTDPFEEKHQREFLGDVLADRLMPKTESLWDYFTDAVILTLPSAEQANRYFRFQEAFYHPKARVVPAGEDHKLRWKELLKVPILLRELRTLARTEKLEGLKNRENLYARSLDRLIDKGLESADTTWNVPRARKRLVDVAWRTILSEVSSAGTSGENFTGVLAGEAFEAFADEQDSILHTLGQIGITILESVGNEHGFHALAFRHFSYCEYLAGMKLAGMPSQERTAIVQQHARDPRWRWIFRYALSREEPDGNKMALAELAHALIRYGNPFLVYDAIAEDKVDLRDLPRPRGVPETLDLDRLCRWLVHRDMGAEGNYTGAWDESVEMPAVDSGTLDILESLFDLQYRNSRCLHPAWELLKQSDDPRAGKIRQDFLDEFPRLLRSESKQGEIARRLVNSFVRCPKDPQDDGVPFWMGAAGGEKDAYDNERPQHQVIVTPFKMQSTAVTNEQFKLFDPSAKRDRFSPDDACPVVYVNWYMANMFCLFLGQGYRLPTEAEWEFGCRARPGGDRKTTRFWTGDDDTDLAEAGWYRENWGQKERRTHVVGKKPANAFGLYDVHGNVWE